MDVLTDLSSGNALTSAAAKVDATLAQLPVSPRLLILTGAGCSTGSGIPDYRDRSGAWKRPPPMHLPEFLSSAEARKRYWARSMAGWPHFARARPNAVHRLIARLESHSWVSTVLTQNVDGLHQQAGNQQVIDLHGRLDRVLCLDCDARSSRQDMQEQLEHANPDWHYVVKDIGPDGDVDLEQVDYARFHVPPCSRCGGTLKPDVVFFGDNVPKARVERALEAVAEADALLVVGSSLMVYSGFRYARAAAAASKPLLIFNDGQTRADDLADLKVEGRAADALTLLHELLASRRHHQSN